MASKARERSVYEDSIPEHLSTDPSFRQEEGYGINPERGELGCEVCHSRITRNTESHNEYGHAYNCPHHSTYRP